MRLTQQKQKRVKRVVTEYTDIDNVDRHLGKIMADKLVDKHQIQNAYDNLVSNKQKYSRQLIRHRSM